jgi:hypothetical protein
LRHDFPRVPHLNHTHREFPRSLCLYEQAWPDVAIRWTPIGFVERIRDWLKLTAKGMLHQDDQPLEQLLFGTGLRIILPTELLSELDGDAPVRLDVYRLGNHEQLRNLVALKATNKRPERGALEYIATTFTAQPQTHGIIRSTPSTLSELDEFLTAGGIDLIGTLRKRLDEWEPRLRTARLVVIISFPLRRSDAEEVERWDFWAFLTGKTVREIGVEIGHWGLQDREVARLLTPDDTKRGQGVLIEVVSPYMDFSRKSAAAANGVAPDERRVVAVGAGALGSQVIATLARSGFGFWTVVDEDDLLPHNLARHALPGEAVGCAKADAMAMYLNRMYADKSPAEGVAADVLSPGKKKAVLEEKYADADVLLDVAASVPVARWLAVDAESAARRVSVFLNPQGTDLVVLAEGKDRTVTLDALEMQYYQAAATHAELGGHLASNDARLRYGRTCRDVTTAIPSHLVTMHAAIASQAIRRALTSDNASVRVWRADAESLAVTPVEVEVATVHRQQLGEWTLVIDDRLASKLANLRIAKLPNETGGVLIGAYDLTRRIVYVVDTVASPPDSAEWPTLYIRGSEGLLDQVREFSSGSGGQLEYVGEWHSHPDGCPTLPSSDDLIVFSWLTEHMDAAGLPALMAIVGENASSSWYLGAIIPDLAWSFQC